MKIRLLAAVIATMFLLSGCAGLVLLKKPYEQRAVQQAQVPEAKQEKKAPQMQVEKAEDILPDMEVAARREVNLFLSNFSEAYYDPDGGYYSNDEGKINFAYLHALINNQSLTTYEDNKTGISAADMDTILIRFFGSSVPHKTPENSKTWTYQNGKFLCAMASGDSYGDFSVATAMTKRSDGNFDVSFNVYYDTTVTGGDILSDKTVYSLQNEDVARNERYLLRGSGSAVLKAKKHNGSDTYEVVSYKVSYKN